MLGSGMALGNHSKWVNKMKKLKKNMQKGMFKEVHDELINSGFNFILNDIVSLFPFMNSYEIYLFMMYSISVNETPEKHILICEDLMFMDPCISDSHTLIAWHLRRALEISPNDLSVLQWITCTYNSHPDSPFSEEELKEYNCRLQKLEQQS